MLDRIGRLLKEPHILLEKPLISCVIGAAFITAGLLSLAFMRDPVFFAMSLVIAGYCVYIAAKLFRQVLHKEYMVLEGKCAAKHMPALSGYALITIEDKKQGPVCCKLPKRAGAAVSQDRFYRIYFMGNQDAQRGYGHDSLWAVEEMPDG